MNGKEFLGRGLKFPLQVDPRTGKFAMVGQEEDIREALFYKLADAKCPILELNHKVPTLEEVFLRLTGEGTKQYGGKMSKEEKKKMRQKLAKREEIVEKEVAEKEVENTEDRAEQMEEKE